MTQAESHVRQSGKLSYRSDVLRPIPHRAAIQQSVNGGRGGEGWGYRTVVAGPSGGRQEEMRIIAAAVGGTALLVQTAQHALRDARGDGTK